MTQPSRDLEPVHSARDLYGVELRRQRQLIGLSLDRMSDIVNYSKTHLHGVETGNDSPATPLGEAGRGFRDRGVVPGVVGGGEAGVHAEAV
ncbi:hypothetical protein ACR6C2_17200 [Streptomyces sp. INA 01156]